MFYGTTLFSFIQGILQRKNLKKGPKEEWVIFEITHDAIVDPETCQTAQRCWKIMWRTDTTGEPNPLTGLLYCADCGRRLFNHRCGPVDKLNKKSGNINHEQARSDYYCPTYSDGRGDCIIHFISSKSANALILETIKRVSGYARNNETEFISTLREVSSIKQDETAKTYGKRIAKNKKRIAELDSLFHKTL